ncbi:MAG: hypothetical protein ABGZ35_04835 [Planctomycetaceae bacterium]
MAESWNWAGDDKYKQRQRQRSFVRGMLLTAGFLLFVAAIAPACRSADDVLNGPNPLSPQFDSIERPAKSQNAMPARLLLTRLNLPRDNTENASASEADDGASSEPRETWLKMAADELRNASPDDAGFAEGWLPIAEAWQLVGNDAEARDAIRSAREALPRMTLVERVIESTIDLCQHESFDQAFSEQLIRDAARMCEQVSDKWDRSTFYAHLSGLAATCGHRALAAALLKQSLGLINMKAGGFRPEKLVFTQQSRAAAWTDPPVTILAICRKLDRLRFPDPLVNANVYAHLAMSAARHHDRPQFLRGMFRAETALAPVRIYDHPNYLYAVRLAEANLLQRRWRAAVIIANNIPRSDDSGLDPVSRHERRAAGSSFAASGTTVQRFRGATLGLLGGGRICRASCSIRRGPGCCGRVGKAAPVSITTCLGLCGDRQSHGIGLHRTAAIADGRAGL